MCQSLHAGVGMAWGGDMDVSEVHSLSDFGRRTPDDSDGLRSLRGICHDVGQELAVVQALARLTMIEEDLPDRARERLETIGEHAAYVAQMVRDSVVGVMDCTEFDLAELVRRTVGDVRLWTPTNCVLEANPLPVVADAILLRRAVVNLLVNAVRAAGPDGLLLARVRREGDLAIVEIEDDGPGWGHGPAGIASLGLGVAHSCVAAHAGDLDLETGQLGGALVRLRFPVDSDPMSDNGPSDGERIPTPAGERA
jgi:K+-sensing histidine kinase KdpD